MKKIAVVCVVGVLCGALVAGCGGRKPEQTGLPAVYGADPNVSLEAVDACHSADNDARRQLMTRYPDPVAYHDALIKMIAVCRPIMSAFNLNSSNPEVASTAKICKQALETQLLIYQKRADGDRSDEANQLMLQMMYQRGDCLTAEEKLNGTYKPPPPDDSVTTAADNSMSDPSGH